LNGTGKYSQPRRRVSKWFVAIFVTLLIVVGVAAIFYFRPIEAARNMTRAALRLRGVQSRYVNLGGYRVHYNEAGPEDGETLVLIHGLGGSTLDWAPVMPVYAKAGFHVYAIDLLGFGKTVKPDIEYSILQQAQLVNEFFDSKGIQQADVIGWSMGGWVSLLFTLQHPDRVKRLVVNDSAGLLFHSDYGPYVFTTYTPDGIDLLFRLLEPKAKPAPRFVVNDMIRNMQNNSMVMHRALDSMVAGKDLLDGKLGGIHQRTLVIWGADDDLIPVATGRQMAQEIPGADFVVFDACGHLAPARCSRAVSEKTLEFLQSPNPPQGTVQEVPAP
jgi:pimeloyl-ACP methyl ester carboxylesterase